jgi:hypothetical protein
VLGQIGVVLGAHQADVLGAVVSAQAEGVNVVVLEMVALLAPSPRRVDVAALASIALVYGPANSRGNVPRRGRRIGRRGEALTGPARRGEAAGFEPLQLLGDGHFDDGAEIPVRDLRAHERSKALELLAQPGAGGELHLVSPGSEGLNDGGRGRRIGTRRA